MEEEKTDEYLGQECGGWGRIRKKGRMIQPAARVSRRRVADARIRLSIATKSFDV